jgi:hypothetical protein
MTTPVFASGHLEIPLLGATGFAGGEIGWVRNPEGVPLILTDVKIYVETASTAASNINVGINASPTAVDADLIAALAINGAIAGTAYHGLGALVAKGAVQVWGAADYITATGTADSTGFRGRLYISYIRINS